MDLTESECRSALAAARVARLATVDAEARPHLVPITFALDGDRVYTAVDAKPKRTDRLRRLRNIEQNPRVSLLIDEYDEDWERLWWVRLDGSARILTEAADRSAPVRLLVAKYAQYAVQDGSRAPQGPVIEITVSQWRGWRYAQG